MTQEAANRKPGTAEKAATRGKSPGGSLFDLLEEIVEFFLESLSLSVRAVATILQGGVAVRDLITQMALIGVDAAGIVIAISVSSGAVFALYTATLALSIGYTEVVGGTLGYAFLNELGPVLGGIAFAARSGAAIAAEIGTMVVTEQVDALRAMAVSPMRYLVAPRVLAAVLMLPLLTVIADLTGLVGGYFSATGKGIPAASFIASVYKYTRTVDLTNGLIKSVVFAFIIGIVACQQGLRTRGGATGVGRSTTRSVVLCVVLITIADLFLAILLNQQTRR